jgi:hypothetical protein
LAVLSVLVYLGDRARRASLDWLAIQPQYQVRFDEIQLVDCAGRPAEPPRWYRGGARAFLENVRLEAREREGVSLLSFTPDRLSLALEKYAWVEDVIRVVYHPGGIHVELRYRQPVAWVQLRDGDQIVVDEEATILRASDVDVAELGRVIKIRGDLADRGLARPSELRYGVKWKSRGTRGDLDRVDERILAAAKLAAFLMGGSRPTEGEKSAALRLIQIDVTSFRPHGLLVYNAEGAAIWWGDAPGAERPETLSADEKWAMLRRWAQTTHDRFLETGDLWRFTRDGVKFVCTHTPASHRSKTSSERLGGKNDAQ